MELKEPKVKAKAKGEYQTTELGVIPADWQVKKLGEIGDCLIGLTYTPGQVREHGTLVLRSSNVANGKLVFGDNVFVEADIPERIMVQENDILICVRNGSRDLIGKSALVDRRAKGMTFGAFMAVFRTPAASFVFNQFQSEVIKRQIHEHLGATINQITNKSLKSFQIPYTEDPAEQHAIATALSDVDELIAGLEGLLAKKRMLKQGAMQQLLSGQKRLPGFTGVWGVKTFRELFSFGGGYSASRAQLTHKGHSYLHYGDIHMASHTLMDVQAEYHRIPRLDVPLTDVSPVSLLCDGDVVFVDASEDDDGVSKHVVVSNPEGVPFISGLHTIVAKPRPGMLDKAYARYCFQTADMKSQFHFYAVGTKVSGISKSNIPKLTMPLPSPKEQAAIGAILSDMDAELGALQAKLGKTRLLKQGMMQELLTGRVRLV